MRKLRTTAGDKSTTDVKEVVLSSVYGSRYKLPINHPIIDSHWVFYAKALPNTLTFEVTLPKNEEIVFTCDTTKPYTYSLSNIELEYECVRLTYLAGKALSTYALFPEN